MGNPFSGKNSKPPPAPDYAGAAIAQGQANKEAAIAASQQNNPNVVSPYGTQTWTDPETGRPTMTQTLSPEQQAILDQSNEIKMLMGGIGQENLQGAVRGAVDFSGVPEGPGSYEDTRTKVINAMMSRADEDYGQQKDQANSDLIAAGLRPGTPAYDNAMQRIERSRNDARAMAESNAGAEVARAFGQDDARRKAGIAEYLATRSVPLNEATALASGSQVANPFATTGVAQNAQIAPAPLFGATTAAGNYGVDTYNANQARTGGITSGLFGLGAAAIPWLLA